MHEKVRQKNKTLVAETQTPIRGGEPRYFEVVLNPIHDAEGAVSGIAVTTRDIDARKKAEVKVAEQLDELRRWHNVTLGREERILELKAEVNRLLKRLDEPPRYGSALEV